MPIHGHKVNNTKNDFSRIKFKKQCLIEPMTESLIIYEVLLVKISFDGSS